MAISAETRVREFPDEPLKSDCSKLVCLACHTTLSGKKIIIMYISHIATARHKQGKSHLERETQRQKMVKESFLAYRKRLGKALAGTGLTEAVSSAESLRRIQIVRSMLQAGIPLATDHLGVPCGPNGPASLTEFSPVTPSDVQRLLQQVDARKATGIDGIPGSLLRQCSDLLAYSLAVLFCTSLRTGTVPLAFKLATVVPLYKTGDPSVPTNYHPVSLLPVVSKLLERVVQRQLVRHLDLSNALPDSQFAFRKKCSTEDALCVLTDSLQKAKDSGLVTGLCLLDMSKAFDKVRHGILIQDLFDVGISGVALKWFANYLTDRRQQVTVASATSRALDCTCGVPQGSVLGPVLFNVYTRDVKSVSSPIPSVQFADDIALYDSKASAGEVSKSVSSAVTDLAIWLKSRGLILNASKSQVMTISPQHAGPEVSIVCCDTSLPIVKSARYLGVFLDNRLSWDVHVSAIVTKVARKIRALWRARRCLSRSSRKVYVKAIVIPDMIYGACSFSAALRVTQLQRLQAMQNRAIRCIDGSPPCSAMQPLLAANSIYRVTELFKQKLLIFIWRCLNDSTSLALAQQHAAAEVRAISMPMVCSASQLAVGVAKRDSPPQEHCCGTVCLERCAPYPDCKILS